MKVEEARLKAREFNSKVTTHNVASAVLSVFKEPGTMPVIKGEGGRNKGEEKTRRQGKGGEGIEGERRRCCQDC